MALQRTVASLQTEIAAVKEQKGVRIDRIEYSFDQLKVERLEGTLNIGVAPGGLQSVEDFAVNGASATIGSKPGPAGGVPGPDAAPQGQPGAGTNQMPPQQPASPPCDVEAFRAADSSEPDWLDQVGEYIHGFLSEDMAKELRQWTDQYRLPLDEASQRLVIEDIRAQIDDRIRYYAKQGGAQAGAVDNFQGVTRDIIEKTKRDIRTAIEQYIAGIAPKDGET
jgi:spore germination protein PC